MFDIIYLYYVIIRLLFKSIVLVLKAKRIINGLPIFLSETSDC